MADQRTTIPDFNLYNPFYAGATVSVFTIDELTSQKTTTLATLYQDLTSALTLDNPQKLDSNGRFQVPVYVDQPVIMTISGLLNADDHDTGIVAANLLGTAVTDAQAAASQSIAFFELAKREAARASKFANLQLPDPLGANDYVRGDGASGYERRTPAQARGDLGAAAVALTNTFTATQNMQALLDVQRALYFSGDLSPAQITADQNNYNPTNLSTANTLRLESDAARTITGLQGGVNGRILVVRNIGSFRITLANQSTSSTAANRFNFGSDLRIDAGESAILRYDGNSTRWTAISRPLSAAGGGIVQIYDAEVAGSPANIDITWASASYRRVLILPSGLLPSADAYLACRFSEDDGSTFESGAAYYSWSAYFNTVAGAAIDADASDSEIELTDAGSGNNFIESTGVGFSGDLVLINPEDSGVTTALNWLTGWQCSLNPPASSRGQGYQLTASRVNGFRLFFPGGATFEGGRVTAWGFQA